MNGRLAAAGVMVGLFFAGGVAGAATMHFLRDDPEPRASYERRVRDGDRDRGRSGDRGNDRGRRSPRAFATEQVVESLTERLELTPVQRDSLENILEAQQTQANTIMQEMWPRLRSTVDSANALFRQVLDAEQQATFDELLEEHRGVLGRPPPGPESRER
jgi:hypothetical protein